MKKFALVFWLAALPAALYAGSGQGVSGNSTVDTTTWFGSGITITFHRALGTVLENADTSARIDDPLWVDATKSASLGTQETLLAPDALGDLGLVADGVTPLLVKISCSGTLPQEGQTFELNVSTTKGGESFSGAVPIRMVDDISSRPKLTFTLTPSRRTAFAVIGPVDADQITSGLYTWFRYRGKTAFQIEVRKQGALLPFAEASKTFCIRKPPVLLVHGYSADAGTWEAPFTDVLEADRGSDFVLAVNYGTENDNHINTTAPLADLIPVLETALEEKVAPLKSSWAFSRYDAIGHSQGGVLLRFLCSSNENASFKPFRNDSNFCRGRFRRVVTIGSPHVGSTMCELGTLLYGNGSSCLMEIADVTVHLQTLLQVKFRIGNGTQLQILNARYTCDGNAKLHLLRTAVDGGAAPASGGHPFYKALWLNESEPEVGPKTPGQVVAPMGGDGVVDAYSQSAGAVLLSDGIKSSFVSGGNYCHAADPIIRPFVGATQTGYPAVARQAKDLLNGSASQFGPVNIPQWLTTNMEIVKNEIKELAPKIIDRHPKKTEPLYKTCNPFVIPNQPLAARSLSLTGGAVSASFSAQTLNFTLQPTADEPLAGMVTWAAEVYGPDGVEGVTMTTSGTYGEQLTLTVGASVVGEVVLQATYPSSTGKTISGAPGVVLSRPPGTAITAVECVPAAVSMGSGGVIPLELRAVYDGTIRTRVFSNAANTTFSSSNETVATVDAGGTLRLIAPGNATVTATYQGTWSVEVPVSTLGEAPVVTSVGTVSGAINQPMQYQISANQAVTGFIAGALPDGLTLDAATGLISGTPSVAGRFGVEVGATNANGTGRKDVEFAIAGPSGPPTGIGFDAEAVANGAVAGTVVGRFSTADPNPLDTFTYSLVAGVGSSDNAKLSISGAQLLVVVPPDMAAGAQMNIRVRSTDASGGTVEQAFTFSVTGPPYISEHPSGSDVYVGDTVAFAGLGVGKEPLAYQWSKNGTAIEGATARFFSIASAAASDAGTYTVKVTNDQGEAVSNSAALVVRPASYDIWATRQAGSSNLKITASEDYNSDGTMNLFDFAFSGVLGDANTRAYMPVLASDAGGLYYSWREPKGLRPQYDMLVSSDLQTWTDYVPPTGALSRIDHGSYEEVRVSVPTGNPPTSPNKIFFRLRIRPNAN